MPRLYRPMKAAADGLPVVGTQSKELGIRLPPNDRADVEVDLDGRIVMNRRGMSVTANWRLLKPHLIPRRLKNQAYGASGPNSLVIYRFGDGTFVDCALNDRLALALKRGSLDHGNIVPVRAVTVVDFLTHLGETRERWIPEESP